MDQAKPNESYLPLVETLIELHVVLLKLKQKAWKHGDCAQR
jgi:hypothetical protein